MEEKTHFLAGWRLKALLITIVLSIIGYLIFTLWAGWDSVIMAAQKVGILGVIIALSLSLINYSLRFLRWSHFLKILGEKIPFLDNLRIYIAGFAFTATPGKAGEAFRGVFLKDFGVTYRKSFGAFFAERLSDLIAIVIIAMSGLLIYPQGKIIVILVLLAIVALLSIVQSDTLLKKLERFSIRILPIRFGHFAEFMIETIIAFRSCFRFSALTYGICLGVIAWGMEGIAFYYLLHLLGSNIDLFTSQFIYAFSLLIGAISFLPGGLGGVEVTMLQLLLLNNVDASTAVVVTILIRFTTLWFSVVLGLFCIPKIKIEVQ